MLRVERWTRDTSPTPRELSARLAAEGYSSFPWSDPPGRTYEDHSHADDQSHWILSGYLALVVDGAEYVLGPGDRDYLPAGTIHSARVVGSEEVVYLIASKG